MTRTWIVDEFKDLSFTGCRNELRRGVHRGSIPRGTVMLNSIRIRSWHIAMVAIITTVAVAIVLTASTAEASKRQVNAGVPLAAPYHEPIPAHANYKGWGSVKGYGYNPSTRYDSARFAAPAPSVHVAWHWNGTRWIQRERSGGTQVY